FAARLLCTREGRADARDPGLPHQSLDRPYAIAARENIRGQDAIFHAQVIPEQALEHGTQIRRRLEVALLMEIGLLEARPIGDDPATLERATDQQRHRGSAMIGAVVAVEAGSAAELGNERHYGLAPGCAHVGLDRRQSGVERTEQLRQPAVDHAFVYRNVPTIQ